MDRRSVLGMLAMTAGLKLAGCTQIARDEPASGPPPRLDVIWVPSDLAVVNEMLSLAGVRADDVVYDLGCGDGRIVIEAARRFGARAVGGTSIPSSSGKRVVTPNGPRSPTGSPSWSRTCSRPTSRTPRWSRSTSPRTSI